MHRKGIRAQVCRSSLFDSLLLAVLHVPLFVGRSVTVGRIASPIQVQTTEPAREDIVHATSRKKRAERHLNCLPVGKSTAFGVFEGLPADILAPLQRVGIDDIRHRRIRFRVTVRVPSYVTSEAFPGPPCEVKCFPLLTMVRHDLKACRLLAHPHSQRYACVSPSTLICVNAENRPPRRSVSLSARRLRRFRATRRDRRQCDA